MAYLYTMSKLAQDQGVALPEDMTYAPQQMGDVTPVLNRLTQLERERVLPTSGASGQSITGAGLRHALTKIQNGEQPTPMEASMANQELNAISQLRDSVGDPALNQNMVAMTSGVLQAQAASISALTKVASNLSAKYVQKPKQSPLMAVANKLQKHLK
jgi:hypothetical protein